LSLRDDTGNHALLTKIALQLYRAFSKRTGMPTMTVQSPGSLADDGGNLAQAAFCRLQQNLLAERDQPQV
jgi:hypothetical protein